MFCVQLYICCVVFTTFVEKQRRNDLESKGTTIVKLLDSGHKAIMIMLGLS
ncbi:Hypothetical protein FKW44_000779 [Caligus rogercresseyi]|uniref:Uncharacterized protein n=1 Tax=Caligus rogercresseyi TaxID=217165 RepID=A0A7T8QV36_CALRO|nr:Hypothetical protein FKW44_000779 [Caligus rogercresseyi]